MKINWKTTTKICVALLAWDALVQLNNHRAIKRLERHKMAMSEINHLLAQTLDRHEIELDPFEMIAIEDLIRSNK